MLLLTSIIVIVVTSVGAQHAPIVPTFINADPMHRIVLQHRERFSEVRENGRFLNDIRSAMYSGRLPHDLYDMKVPAKCSLSMTKLMGDLVAGKAYAWKMIDSWGKLESGVATYNIMWEGRYFECEGIVEDGETFKGKWCSANLEDVPPYIGVCFPDTCSSDNIATILDAVAGAIDITKDVTVICAVDPHQWDALTIVATVITGILLLLVVVGTWYTMYDNRKNVRGNQNLGNHKSFWIKSISSFSLVKNTKSIMNTEKRKGNIHCIHGMRFISFTWVVLGHVYVIFMPMSDNLWDEYDYARTHFSFMAIISASYSVDTFFFLSGLLVCFLGLKQMKKQKGRINVPMMYLHRYLRLTPVYAFCILIYITIFVVVGDSPWYNWAFDIPREACSKYWWTSLIYINNLYPTTIDYGCLFWGWYLANDMQFYLLSPVFLILLYRKPTAGIVALVIGILCNMTITGSLSWYYGIGVIPDMMLWGANYDSKGNASASAADTFGADIYGKPWCRIGVYFVGMLTGYILYATKGQLKIKQWVVAVGWLLTAGLEMMLVYGLYRHANSGEFSSLGFAAFYNAVSRPMWAVGLGWIVIACVSGYGGIVNRFLSWRVFIPLGRLSYSAYLIHLVLIEVIGYSSEVNLHFSNILYSCLFVAIVSLACAFAYVLACLVEYPFMGILDTSIKQSYSRKKDNGTVRVENENGDEKISYTHGKNAKNIDNKAFEMETNQQPTKF